MRHGDLKIVKIGHIKGRKQENNILLEGEAAGHKHRLQGGTATVYELTEPEMGNNGLLVKTILVEEPTTLIHEDHNPLLLERGVYGVVRQREQLLGEVRDVTD